MAFISKIKTPDTMGTSEWCLGSIITAKTSVGDSFTGEVFAYDPELSILVLKDIAPNIVGNPLKKENYRIIKTDFLQEFKYTGHSKSAPLPIEPLSVEKIKTREQQAIKQINALQAKIGVGVSEYAQITFDLLSKTLPCRWNKDKIVVMDNVIIAHPYSLADISGKDSIAVSQVKKVLEGERKKIETNTRSKAGQISK